MFSNADGCMGQVTVHQRQPTASVLQRYELASVVAFISTGRTLGGTPFAKVALQFPDELLPDSVAILQALARQVGAAGSAAQLFVLADTTFGSCCPDEVTAQHYAADAIVHFGFACYSRTCGIPVHYNTPSWDPTATVGSVADKCREITAAGHDVTVVAYPGTIDLQPSVAAALGVAVELAPEGRWLEGRLGGRTVVFAEATSLPSAQQERPTTEWCVNGATFPVAPTHRVVFWGPPAAPQLQQLMLVAAYNASHDGADAEDGLLVIPHDAPGAEPSPVEQRPVSTRLRQRMFNIETVKQAAVVGIVVASLSIEGYRSTAERLRTVLRRHKKRAYIIFVGHLNPFKLGNFADSVDCFAVIACPNSRMAHFPNKSDDLLKPLVSPIEVMLALGYADFISPRSFSTHFDHVLSIAEQTAAEAESSETAEAESEATSLVPRASSALTAMGSGGSLQRLHERSYVGLEPRVGETQVQAELVAGKDGIARGYAAEKDPIA